MTDDEIKSKAEEIAQSVSCDPKLNNPGGLLWAGQHGALPSEPVVLPHRKDAPKPQMPLARFDTIENGWAALYRKVKEDYGSHR